MQIIGWELASQIFLTNVKPARLPVYAKELHKIPPFLQNTQLSKPSTENGKPCVIRAKKDPGRLPGLRREFPVNS